MRVITVVNQKGGVGKTTTSLALCAGFARKGFRVLGIDLDPQGNFSDTVGIQNDEKVYSVENVLKLECLLKDAVQTSAHGFDAVPSGRKLSLVEGEIDKNLNKYYLIKEQLSSVDGLYDYVIIDVPPSLGIFTLNALTASNEVLIPSLPEKYSLSGITELYKTVRDVKKYNGNPGLTILGIVFTMYDSRAIVTKAAEGMAGSICEALNLSLFNSKIRICAALKKAQVYQESIFNFDDKSKATIDYNGLIDEIIEKEMLIMEGAVNQ